MPRAQMVMMVMRKYNKSQKIQENASKKKKADYVLIRTFKEKILARCLTISYIYLCSCLNSQLLTGSQNRNWFGNTNSCQCKWVFTRLICIQ